MTKIEHIVTTVRERIQQSEYQAGTRVPSIRAAARLYGVSKNTVAEAYERLVAMGYLQARAGSGFYVAKNYQAPSVQHSQQLAQALNTVSLLREQLVQDYEVRIGDGRPPEQWMEEFNLQHAARLTQQQGPTGFDYGYGNPWGFLPLRERIARFLNERRLPAEPGNILLTHGANHAMDLVARQLLQPGDTVLVDSPGYYPLFGKLKFSHVHLIGVQRRKDGPDVEDFEKKVKHYQPKIFFTQSLAHNPTGSNLSLPVAHRILKIADQYGMYIVEDDVFADIMPAENPRLATLDQLERVIYIGSFSKTLSASLRVGYVTGNNSLVRALCDLKMITLVSTSDFLERIVCGLIDSGQYRRHLKKLRDNVSQANARAVCTLKNAGLDFPFGDAGGGYYLWAHLPGQDEQHITRQAASAGIFLAPGSLFFPQRGIHTDYPAFRINIAYATHQRFLDFLAQRLG